MRVLVETMTVGHVGVLVETDSGHMGVLVETMTVVISGC